MKKLNSILLSLFISTSIIACGGGGSSSSSVPVYSGPSASNWVSTNFNSWKQSQNLGNYSFYSRPIINDSNTLFFYGTTPLNESSAFIRYDVNAKKWTNVTYNLPNPISFRDAYSFENKVYIETDNNLYKLNNESWNLVKGIESGYSIVNLVGYVNNLALSGDYQDNINGALAKDENDNYKVYLLRDDTFIDILPTPINIPTVSGQLLSLFFDQNDSAKWALSVNQEVSPSVFTFNYYTYNSNGQPLGNLSNDKGFSAFPIMTSGKFFVMTADNSNNSIFYMCDGTSCNIVNGFPQMNYYLSVVPPIFNKSIIKDSKFITFTDSVAYQRSESNGNVLQYSCNIDESGSNVTDCTQLGNTITPLYYESSNLSNGIFMISFSINDAVIPFLISSSEYIANGNYNTNGYGYYVFESVVQGWQQVAPSFTNLLVPNDYRYQIFSLCSINPSSSLFLDVNNNINNAQQSQLTMTKHHLDNSINNAYSTNAQYVSYDGSWINMAAPGNDLTPLIGNQIISGSTVSMPSMGFYSILVNQNSELGELYINLYSQSCSRTF